MHRNGTLRSLGWILGFLVLLLVLTPALHAAIEDHAISRGWVRRADRTLFYFYGESFHEMKERLSRILADDPRFAGASFRRLA